MTTRVHVLRDDAIGDLDSVGVAAAVAAGSISALEAARGYVSAVHGDEQTLLELEADRPFARIQD